MWQSTNNPTIYWPRAIIFIDMNAFFAAIEQLDNKHLRGQPIGITNGKEGTCIITCSYEARAYGVKTGMRFYDAKNICPQLIQIPARPERYVQVSQQIMLALHTITPDVEVFSVDEAFLDVTRCQLLFGTPEKIGLLTKIAIDKAVGLPCSIGISGDKTTAKFAAKLQKPKGFVVIPPWEARSRLQNVLVTELCGINEGIGRFLASHGVIRCGDIENLPISILGKRFGNIGRRIWYMCQGSDPDPVHTKVPTPKTMGHGKVMPPNTSNSEVVEAHLMHMCEKLGSRLRHHYFLAQYFYVGVLNRMCGWLGGIAKTIQATNDGKEIFHLGLFILGKYWQGEPVYQIQVTALDPISGVRQLDFLNKLDEKRMQINEVLDEINDRYGEFTIAPGPLLFRSKMPNVIAPAWKPEGHRQTI